MTSRLLDLKVLYKDGQKISPFDKELTREIVNLQEEQDNVFTPTGKTGKLTPMLTTKYADKLLKRITNGCVEIKRGKL